MNNVIGIAVASQELKLLLFDGDSDAPSIKEGSESMPLVAEGSSSAGMGSVFGIAIYAETEGVEPNGESEKKEEDKDVLVLPYNEQGLNEILRIAEEQGVSTIVLAGNRLWAKPIAYTLACYGKEIRYVAPRKQERGKVTSQAKFLRNALAHGFTGRPFFGPRYKNGASSSTSTEATAHPWHEVASRGAVIKDDLRRAKHRIQNVLRLIFPELISLEQKLWGKRAVAALLAGEYSFFSRYGLDYTKSLARYIPGAETYRKRDELIGLLAELHAVETRKSDYEDEVDSFTHNHPIVAMFEGSSSARELALLIGWQKWGRAGDNADQRRAAFRRLRKYCGLDVSRVDSKGNPRISRERPETRVALYHLLKTGVAKNIIAEAMERLGRDKKMKRPKRMEILLKVIWKQCLLER